MALLLVPGHLLRGERLVACSPRAAERCAELMRREGEARHGRSGPVRRRDQGLLTDRDIDDGAEDEEDPHARQEGTDGGQQLPRVHGIRVTEGRRNDFVVPALIVRIGLGGTRGTVAGHLPIGAGAAFLDLAHKVVLARLQLGGRSHGIQYMVEGGRDLVPALGQPSSAEALAEAGELLVGQDDLEDTQRVDELHDVRDEDEDPAKRDRGGIVLHPELQGHSDRGGEDRQGAEELALGQELLAAALRRDNVEAQDESQQHSEHESASVRHPECAKLDVDVAQTVEAQGLEVVREAEEDADAGVDVVLIELLLDGRIQPEVLGGSVSRELRRHHGSGAVHLELRADPGRALGALRGRGAGATAAAPG
mmetsp:Transcript_74591/g.213731  ORF Transcript_74591/g.213731 Transcript_74591/m.213731 type:complete len:366 (-) Transcript_74591:583-1680(-)